MTIAADNSIVANTDTLEDLLEALGGISAKRVLCHPLPGQATEADLLNLLERKKRLCELIDGILVEKPMGSRESRLTIALTALLHAFVAARNLGFLNGPDGPIRFRPGLVRLPDLAFISWARTPGGEAPADPILPLVPDLAIEVLSRSNTPAEMRNKRREYFESGVRLVWIFDPESRTVEVYSSASDMQILSERDTLEGGAILPGFSISLRKLFGELDRSARG